MKEKTIKKYFKRWCKKYNWLCWFPIRNRFKKVDIFGVFDVIIIKRSGEVGFVQLTTKSNISARRRKIEKWLAENQLPFLEMLIYIFGFDKKTKEFKKIKINELKYYEVENRKKKSKDCRWF